MRSLSITFKDIQLALKDPGTLVNLFLLPMLFIFVFSGGLTSLGEGAEDNAVDDAARVPLPIVNLDQTGGLADTFLAKLAAAGSVDIALMTQAEADTGLDANEIRNVLIIPATFSTDFEAGKPVTLQLVNHPYAGANEIRSLQLAIDGAAQDLALEQQLVASLEHMGQMQAAAAPEQQAFSTERIVAQAKTQFERAQERPLLTVTQVNPGASIVDGRESQFRGIQVSVPGFAVLFIFLTAQATARSIYDEKKTGSFRRLLAAPISNAGLLVGKMLPNFIVALIQFVVIFAVAIVALPWAGLDRLTLGASPLALTLLCLLIALCSTSLGIFIAAFARTESQIGGLSTLLIWGMGILGGAIIPPFLLSDALDTAARVVPQYWALDGFRELLVLSGGLADIVPALLALAGFSILFFGLGLWRFEFE